MVLPTPAARRSPRQKLIVAMVASALAVIGAAFVGACASRAARSDEGWNATQLPTALADDYQIFALRCSKCHSLARPLQSGIDDDDFWTAYVARMRRQPSSGISPRDAAPILRFLRYYASEQRKKKGESRSGKAKAKEREPAEVNEQLMSEAGAD
jgi:hypothetical protein